MENTNSGGNTQKRYVPTALALYINYIVHGMGVIILSQNQNALMEAWNTDITGVGLVISMLGIGRFIAIYAGGRLSDKFGRKPFVYLGMIAYIIFFAGILFSPNIYVAMLFAVIAGIANSFLDSGTYPALMEAFPDKAGSANVLIKAFVQVGQFFLPFIVGYIITNDLWYGWSFIIAIVFLVLNGIFLSRVPFPDEDMAEAEEVPEEMSPIVYREKANKKVEGIAFILYGFTAQATFYLVSQYINQYGQYAAGMAPEEANLLLSYYSVGSLLCVFVTAVLATKVRSVYLMTVYTVMSFVSILVMYLWPTPEVLKIGSALVGFFAAGGVLQLGLTVMGEMFPEGKGTVTGIYYTAGSIASFLIPIVASRIALPSGQEVITAESIRGIMLMDSAIAAVGVVLAFLILYRYRQVIDLEKSFQ
jgi:MFS family permease